MSQLQYIQDLRKRIEQRWGSSALPAADFTTAPTAQFLSASSRAVHTSFPALDRALGVGGLPRGRIAELCGERSSGKTSLALRIMAQTLRGDGLVAYIDLERSFHPPTAEAMGVHLPSLVVIRPRTANQALEATATLLQSEGFDMIVHDLASGTASPDTTAMARLATLASKTRALLLFLTTPAHHSHHWSESPAESSPLAFFSTVRIRVQRTGGRWHGSAGARETEEGQGSLIPFRTVLLAPTVSALTRHLELAGYGLAVTIVKNKLGPFGATVELELSPWRADARDEDRMPVDSAVSDLGGATALAGTLGATVGHRRRAV